MAPLTFLFRKENSFGFFFCKDLCMNFINQVTDSMSDALNVFFCWPKEHKPSQIVSKITFSGVAIARSLCLDLRSLGGFIGFQTLSMTSSYHDGPFL